jgi:hypothetical protein
VPNRSQTQIVLADAEHRLAADPTKVHDPIFEQGPSQGGVSPHRVLEAHEPRHKGALPNTQVRQAILCVFRAM